MPENKQSKSIVAQVADRIKDSDNVLVALSKNPSVDELSAALGLSFVLDKLGKHATAIFSGAVPNAIEFLEPEKTFESNTNSLQDFIIALNKEKADHLRYKIEGDFVKVYITPYKTTLSEKDFEFTHGDYNVDLIISLNVKAESDLDSALSEYGKIKHDAGSINISASAPGKFADLEWGDPNASSVSEMIADLATVLDDGGEEKLVDKSTATALLAGIVAATNRFSNEHTSADTMSIASTLMTDGADQQLISSSIPVDITTNNGTVDINKEVEEATAEAEQQPVAEPVEAPAKQADPTELTIERNEPTEAPAAPAPAPVAEPELSAAKPDNVPDLPTPEPSPVETVDETPTAPEDAPKIETIDVPAPAEAAPVDLPTPELEPLGDPLNGKKELTPPSEADLPPKPQVDYAAEMAQALQEPVPTPTPAELPTAEMAPVEAPVAPMSEVNSIDNATPVIPQPIVSEAVQEPAAAAVVPPTAEFQPAPNVDPSLPPVAPTAEYVTPPLPMPADGAILPPPPVPFTPDGMPLPPASIPTAELAPEPVPSAQPEPTPAFEPDATSATDFVADPLEPAPQPVEPIMPAVLQEADAQAAVSPSVNGVNPVMQDQVYNDPGAFRIPGM